MTNSELLGKEILYIAPKFFGYEKEIKQSLINEFGASVDFYDDRPSSDILTKIFIRLKLKLFVKRKIDLYYKAIFCDIEKKVYDYIFIVSPETLSQKELKVLKNLQPHAKFILYMWDSFNNKNSLDTINIFDRVLSFDSRDVAQYNLFFCPLFYCDSYTLSTKSNEIFYDLCSIATAHSDRYKLVSKIKKQLEQAGFKMFSFLYLPSKIMYWGRKVFLKKYQYGNLNEFAFIPMQSSKIVSMISHSKAILDINHPAQHGLTMRTFEAFGMHKKLVTTNINIKNYDFYNKSNILVIDRENPIVDTEFFTTPYVFPSQELYEKYSLHSWIKFVFEW
ncbi:MAG: hypothetical protein J0647_02615 [Campylobacteraceae bacterium]|nr:hypothetical protein [Campylobacteraceae bacterium]